MLSLDTLQVDTFETETVDALSIPDDMKCTGCDSGCGIIWP